MSDLVRIHVGFLTRGSIYLNRSVRIFLHFLSTGDSEVQRTMLELLNQLDGFEPKQNIKVSLTFTINVLFLINFVLVKHFLASF